MSRGAIRQYIGEADSHVLRLLRGWLLLRLWSHERHRCHLPGGLLLPERLWLPDTLPRGAVWKRHRADYVHMLGCMHGRLLLWSGIPQRHG